MDNMASSARLIMARNQSSSLNSPNSVGIGSSSGYVGATSNQTLALITDLAFAESKSVRTSTVILAAFNILASLGTAMSIIYDCYWASRRCNPKFKASKFCISTIHPAETFPLVLSIGIVIQGFVFAGVQGAGLQALFEHGCSLLSQFMWPALFIVPYIQLVFGLECAFRSMRKLPFQARGKYDVTICLGVIVLMLIGTWIPSHLHPEPDFCFASLVWFISRYGEGGFILLAVATGLLIISTIIIFIRLSAVNMIDQHQRIAASRMVYYMVLGIVSMAFVIPYFVSLTMGQGDLKLAMMATVVLNLSGLMLGLLQLFLRSNTAASSFGPKIGRSWDRGRHEIRIWGPNELAFGNQLVNPANGPGRADSRASLVGLEKGRTISVESLNSSPFRSPVKNPTATSPVEQKSRIIEQKAMPSIPEPTAESSFSPGSHARKQSYSLFPTDPISPSKASQPNRPDIESVYDISELAPPPAIFGKGAHRRDSSTLSSATVQIGLRISHAPGPSQERNEMPPLPTTTYNAPTQTPKPEPPIRSPHRPSPLATSLKTETPPILATNKTLPPTPRTASSILVPRLPELDSVLSPAVYSPDKKNSPKSTSPQSSSSPQNPLRSNLATGERTKSKADWI